MSVVLVNTAVLQRVVITDEGSFRVVVSGVARGAVEDVLEVSVRALTVDITARASREITRESTGGECDGTDLRGLGESRSNGGSIVIVQTGGTGADFRRGGKGVA